MSLQRPIPVLLVILTALVFASPAFAGPPFITDDPVPDDLGHGELYLGGTYNKTSFAHGGVESAAVPFTEIDYGFFPDAHVHAIVTGEYAHEKQGGEANYGMGDTELGLKYRFIHEDEKSWVPQVGFFPLLEVNTGNYHQGLGNGKLQAFFPIWLQKSWDKWTVFGGGGFFYNANHSTARNFWRTGVVVQRDFSEQLTLGLEIYHDTPAFPGLGGHTAFNLGGYYNFNDHYHLLFSAGRDIDGPNQFMSYLALQYTW
jgi:hypothetical protein